jgi:alkanesulfonate monooxygenase SsuD/methylene tetrahydromethanopterin reductase-like flavin-dependent oxidoreductase (luciferase family)
VGAGWNDEDREPLGLAFPEIGERADLLEDQLELLHGLWTQPAGWSFDGHRIQVRNGALRAGPVDVPGRPRENGRVRPRIITGGGGSPRGYRIAAKYSDEFNLSSTSPDDAPGKQRLLDEACRAIGRDPGTLTRSAMVGTLIGRDDAEVERLANAVLGEFGEDQKGGRAWLGQRRGRWVFGTPAQARTMAARFADAGIERLMLQDFLPRDLDHIDAMADALIGRV